MGMGHRGFLVEGVSVLLWGARGQDWDQWAGNSWGQQLIRGVLAPSIWKSPQLPLSLIIMLRKVAD